MRGGSRLSNIRDLPRIRKGCAKDMLSLFRDDEVHEVASPRRIPDRKDIPPPHAERVKVCLRRGNRLTSWEKDFLQTLVYFQYLTPRQSEVLLSIERKILIARKRRSRRRDRGHDGRARQ
jgi:hypothetical protein